MTDTRLMDLPDGRELAWLELGDPKGPPVLAFHGTPGSRRQVAIDHKPILESGVRFIAPDRPGYGHSTLHPRRRLADWANDVTSLADHLNIERFSVVGVSGGGPHAVACARLLSDRVSAAGIVSGVGPLAEPGGEEGMMPSNQLVTHLARKSQWLVYPLFALMATVVRRWPEQALKAGARQLPQADIEVLSRPAVRAAFIDDFRRPSPTQSLAAAQDFALFARDWGFRLEDIATEVHIWHGDEDRNVPISHGRLQAQLIPGSHFHECPGEGHMLVIDHLGEILRTVTAP